MLRARNATAVTTLQIVYRTGTITITITLGFSFHLCRRHAFAPRSRDDTRYERRDDPVDRTENVADLHTERRWPGPARHGRRNAMPSGYGRVRVGFERDATKRNHRKRTAFGYTGFGAR